MMIEFPAGLAALRHLDQRGADTEAVTDAQSILGQAARGEILAKSAGFAKQRMVANVGAPGGIMFARVKMDGLVRSAMNDRVGNLVARQAKQGQGHGTSTGVRAMLLIPRWA